ncbi:MAG: hypothetical protein DKM50_13735 [Candidatus Margulisiibacteriota bacterium]|nr:MAG: hypothetical protein A2X43_13125 [Candidatus Margulisbacteria bacterium GWD2_39_127]OGI00943.1 MAG: hypothetical protein A2X42_03200 [Candidatus Margulisbacteria bacterium GWF2_38_17]OGI09930.1 MAG: hypothetical protein A2X41_05965 [Candidatus Margulisbacteria bacterium GWE2_39_32]PZM77229.1 MAG: hypothetical protein DKM50_13735 [Candidatus Margulisiibacteriota bacterium]HAR64235.1 hypothetical protein [Candidatus Margulisiibacteriota bacterium]
MYQLGLVILVAFLLGSIPFFSLINYYVRTMPFERVKTRRFPATKTFLFPMFTVSMMSGLVLLDITKGIIAIYIGDQVLGQSDYSLIVATASCLAGNLASQFIFRKDFVSSFLLWGIFFRINPIISLFVLVFGIIIYLIINNISILELSTVSVFLVYYLSSNQPKSFVVFAIIALFYILIKNQEFIRKIIDKGA